jgi:hypothetical protein
LNIFGEIIAYISYVISVIGYEVCGSIDERIYVVFFKKDNNDIWGKISSKIFKDIYDGAISKFEYFM